MTETVISFESKRFDAYLAPEGYLVDEPGCHALFYYYLLARKTLEETELDPIVYADEAYPTSNFKQLFSSIALMYGLQPEQMLPFWVNVDMQCHLLDLPKLPDVDRLRFNKIPEIKTQ